MTGFIKIHKKMLDWGWYGDVNVRLTFFHLLIVANWKDKDWNGIRIKRGQAIIGRFETSKKIGISSQQLRTSLNKLKSTNEITIKTTNKYSVVTIINYKNYQDEEKKATNKTPSKQPTSNQQVTTPKEVKNNKKIYIPTILEFKSYAFAKGKDIDSELLKLKYESWKVNDWKDGFDKPIKNWKSKLLNTIPHLKKKKTYTDKL